MLILGWLRSSYRNQFAHVLWSVTATLLGEVTRAHLVYNLGISPPPETFTNRTP
jgi:hypothetical protein